MVTIKTHQDTTMFIYIYVCVFLVIIWLICLASKLCKLYHVWNRLGIWLLYWTSDFRQQPWPRQVTPSRYFARWPRRRPGQCPAPLISWKRRRSSCWRAGSRKVCGKIPTRSPTDSEMFFFPSFSPTGMRASKQQKHVDWRSKDHQRSGFQQQIWFFSAIWSVIDLKLIDVSNGLSHWIYGGYDLFISVV